MFDVIIQSCWLAAMPTERVMPKWTRIPTKVMTSRQVWTPTQMQDRKYQQENSHTTPAHTHAHSPTTQNLALQTTYYDSLSNSDHISCFRIWWPLSFSVDVTPYNKHKRDKLDSLNIASERKASM